jgi:23S rRNA pseudouridine1911/1915/1917 synthase
MANKEIFLDVLYEDNHIIAINKPAGWLVQGDATGDAPITDIVKEYIKKKYDKPGDVYLGSPHRLDRPVSGVLLFTRTSKALERMTEMFRDRQIVKKYLAVVEKRPKELSGELVNYLVKDHATNITTAYSTQRYKDAKLSTLKYRLIGGMGNQHLLEVIPDTGRSHQIRAQLGKIKSPIRGDVKYGAAQSDAHNGSIYLHAFSLEFIHPVQKEPITIMCFPPEDQIWNLFQHAIADEMLK